MRLSALLLIVFAITCAAEGPLQVVSLEPRGSSGSPGASNALAFLLQKEYVRALAIIDTVYCMFVLVFPPPNRSTDYTSQRPRRTPVCSYGLRISSSVAHFTSLTLQAMETNILLAILTKSGSIPQTTIPQL
jgi:hypothetical protein